MEAEESAVIRDFVIAFKSVWQKQRLDPVLTSLQAFQALVQHSCKLEDFAKTSPHPEVRDCLGDCLAVRNHLKAKFPEDSKFGFVVFQRKKALGPAHVALAYFLSDKKRIFVDVG